MKLGTLSILLSVCMSTYVMGPSNGQPSKEDRIANLEQQIVEIQRGLESCKEILSGFQAVVGEGFEPSFTNLIGQMVLEINKITRVIDSHDTKITTLEESQSDQKSQTEQLLADLIRFEQEHHVPELIKLDQEQLKLKQGQQKLEEQVRRLQKQLEGN